ncbi:hypothetical protein WUBG_05158, partial [Wuchereria bancrofti]
CTQASSNDDRKWMGGETIGQIDKNKLTGEWKDEFDGLRTGLRSKTYSDNVKDIDQDNIIYMHTHTPTHTYTYTHRHIHTQTHTHTRRMTTVTV